MNMLKEIPDFFKKLNVVEFWRRFNNNKFRTRLIVFFLMSIIITFSTSLYTYYNSQMLISSTDSLFKKDIELNQLHSDITTAENNLKTFLSTTKSESMTAFNRTAADLQTWSRNILVTADSTETGLMMQDIANLINTYVEKGAAAVQAKRDRDVDKYVTYYNESTVVAGYLYKTIDALMVQQLQDSAEYYSIRSSRVNTLQMLNIVLIVVVSVIIVVMIFIFSFQLTNPIDKLVQVSKRISQGDFDVQMNTIDSKDEIAVLSKAFQEMVPRLKSYIEGITEKAELEMQLKEEHMQNLTMKNALREAQLHALQSQINPHFIFNTINAGAQIALLEGDNKTSDFLVEAAVLFRYNLKSLDLPVTFKEELDNVRSYIYILKTRFRTVNYIEELSDDAQLLQIKMPRLTLQPIVENAYIHGLSELENGGSIKIKASIENGTAVIRIIDSGRGITKKQREKVMGSINGIEPAPETVQSKSGGHTTGIGLNNIVKRLRLFFGTDDNLFDINSNASSGVCVTLRLPLAPGTPVQ